MKRRSLYVSIVFELTSWHYQSLWEVSAVLADIYTLPKTWVSTHHISVFMIKTRSEDSAKYPQRAEILLIRMTLLGGVPAVVAVEVPWAYVTTPGIPPHRDVD